jgi:RNA polymerase sigma factor (sigma-70 family)
MHSPTLSTAVRRMRSLAAPPADGLSDRELLKRFIKSRDDAAFAMLVNRHGPTVLGVCRRVLNNNHDAEEAFQATFLVLSRRAASIRKTASIGCWLYGVAFRVASRLKSRLARTPRTGTLPDVPAESNDDVSWRDVRRVLDEEVNRLPERLRLPVLLCYFEGETRDEAAEVLGWKLSTLRGRLEDGRLRLRARLARRGIELSAALLAISAATDGSAIDATLLESTIRSITGHVTIPIQSLANGVAKSGIVGKLSLGAGTLLLVIGLGTTLFTFRGQAGDAPGSGPKPPEPPAKSSTLPADLLALMQSADRVWVVDAPTGEKLVPEPIEILKGMSRPDPGYSFAFKAEALRDLPRKEKRWIVFLKSIDEVDHIPKMAPIAGERWYVPADEKTIAALREYVPPCEWGEEFRGLRLGLVCRTGADEPTVEIIMQNVGKQKIRVQQFRGNYFDDWHPLSFTIVSPDKKKHLLDRIGPPQKDSDAPRDRTLQPGERYIHVVRLNRWLIPPDRDRGFGNSNGNAPEGLFARGGEFKVQATYIVHGDDIAGPWVGTIESKPVTVTVPKLGVFGDPAGDYRLRLRQPVGTFRVGDFPELSCDLKFTGKERRSVHLAPDFAGIELDGKWYSCHRDGSVEGKVLELVADSEHDSWLTLKPDKQWIHLRDKPDADDPAVKEAISFQLSAGRHTLRMAYPFSKTERAISNAVTIEVAADGWGEPSGGVKARIRLTKTIYTPGEPLTFELDLKNISQKNWDISPVPSSCQVEMDGRWYVFHGVLDYKSVPKELKPGGELVPFISIKSDENWKTPRWEKEKGDLKESDPAFNFLPLKLTPGTHKIRASYYVGDKVSPATSTVEIEVAALDSAIKALALEADRIWVVNAPTREKPIPVAEQVLKGPPLPEISVFDLRLLPGEDPKKKFIVFLKSDDDGVTFPDVKPWPAEKWNLPYSKETADGIQKVLLSNQWGEEKSGLRMGLRLHKAEMVPGLPVVVEIVFHNNGGKDLKLAQHRFNIYDYWPDTWFEVIAPDGKKWELRKLVGAFRELDNPSVITLKPGESYVQTVHLDTWPAHTDWHKPREPLPNLFTKPGEYTITAHHRYSPPMELGTWTANFSSASEKLVLTEDGWGEASDGIRSRVRLTKAKFKAGDSLAFALDLKNAGDKTVEDYPVGFHAQIELDGTTYRYTAPLSVPTSLIKLEPGKEYPAHVQVATDEWWRDAKGNRLTLTAGKHKVRATYPLTGRGENRVTSQAVEFEVEK